MRTLFILPSRGEHFSVEVIEHDDGSYSMKADADVDVDGSPGWQKDPWGQPDTTLHHNGKPIDSSVVAGIVLPPECILAVQPLVLGCQAYISYKGITIDAVTFDVGPHFKFGELSEAAARQLLINPSPINGGRGRA
jgi:hypothetical protein